MSQRVADLIGVALIAAGLLYLATINFAHGQHHHPKEDEEIHKRFYNTWMMPDHPTMSCCHDRDCYPTEARRIGNRWEAKRREDGRWLVVPSEKVEQNRDNPDGRNHLCAPPPDQANDRVYCFIPGGGT
jgi:hypothetical protein